MEASELRGAVPKVPYERVSAGQVQDELRHRAECAEREEGELAARLAEVRAVRDAAVAGLEQLQVDAKVVDDRDDEATREQAHEARLRGALEEAEGMLEAARAQAADWDAVRESSEAALKVLHARRQRGDGGAAG